MVRLSVVSCEVLRIACAIALFFSPARADDSPSPKRPVPNFVGTKTGQLRDDNGLKTKLVWIAAGSFTMGSPNGEQDRSPLEGAQVQVILTRGFWLGQHEVTQAEWQQVMGTTPWARKNLVQTGNDYAATYVSWGDAMKFCAKLTATEHAARRLPAAWIFTLPTEAQWEYACRAATKTRFSFGDDESQLGDYGWFATNAEDAGEKYAHLVGQKKPNPWGLYDMHGNVFEWCRDRYAQQCPGGRDPEVSAGIPYEVTRNGSSFKVVVPFAQLEKPHRVICGGSWFHDAGTCRSTSRDGYSPTDRRSYLGFRIAAVAAGK
jgi:sulfatase modifying factor 1